MRKTSKRFVVIGLLLVGIALAMAIWVPASLSAENERLRVEGTGTRLSMGGFLACAADPSLEGEPPGWWWEEPTGWEADPTCGYAPGQVKVWQVLQTVELDGGLSGISYNYIMSQYLPIGEYPTWRHGAGVQTFVGKVLGVSGTFLSRMEYREMSDGTVEVIRTIVEGMDGLEGLKGFITFTPGPGGGSTYEGWVTMGPGKHKGLGQLGKP